MVAKLKRLIGGYSGHTIGIRNRYPLGMWYLLWTHSLIPMDKTQNLVIQKIRKRVALKT